MQHTAVVKGQLAWVQILPLTHCPGDSHQTTHFSMCLWFSSFCCQVVSTKWNDKDNETDMIKVQGHWNSAE